MRNVVGTEGNEQTSFAGMLSFEGILPRFAVFAGKQAQEAEATLGEEDGMNFAVNAVGPTG